MGKDKAYVKPFVSLPETRLEPTKPMRIDLFPNKGIFLHELQNQTLNQHKEPEESGKRGKDIVDERKKRSEWTKDDVDWLMELYRKGLSQQKIAEEMGRSRSNICYRLNEILKGKKRKWEPKKEKK